MTVHFYFESVWDTVLNSFIHSASVYSRPTTCQAVELQRVSRTQHSPSVLMSLLHRSELGDFSSVPLGGGQNGSSPFLKEEEEIHLRLSRL